MPIKHTTKHGKVKAQNNKKQHLYAFFIKKKRCADFSAHRSLHHIKLLISNKTRIFNKGSRIIITLPFAFGIIENKIE